MGWWCLLYRGYKALPIVKKFFVYKAHLLLPQPHMNIDISFKILRKVAAKGPRQVVKCLRCRTVCESLVVMLIDHILYMHLLDMLLLMLEFFWGGWCWLLRKPATSQEANACAARLSWRQSSASGVRENVTRGKKYQWNFFCPILSKGEILRTQKQSIKVFILLGAIQQFVDDFESLIPMKWPFGLQRCCVR